MAVDDGLPEGVQAGPAVLAGGPPAERVDESGIAVVHEGEWIVPAAGSQARLTPVGDGGTVVNYYFPVEIEVIGEVDDAVVQRVAAHVFAELERELTSRQ